MKVLTKSVIFENQEFVLIKNQHEGRTYYGTIPCTELDNEGRMKRELNGVQMRISFESAADALNNRRIDVAMTRILDGFKAQGMDIYEAMAAMIQTEEYANLYKHLPTQGRETGPPIERRNNMKYRINYLHKFLHQAMWREKNETVTLEELHDVLDYMEKNGSTYKLVSIIPVA